MRRVNYLLMNEKKEYESFSASYLQMKEKVYESFSTFLFVNL